MASFFATLADNAAAADSLSRLLVQSRALADNTAASDVLVQFSTQARALADNAAAGDALVRGFHLPRSLANGAAAADTMVATFSVRIPASTASWQWDAIGHPMGYTPPTPPPTLPSVPTGVSAALVSGGSLSLSTTFYYVVTAFNGGGESGRSAEVSITPSVTGTQEASLNWSTATGATGYKIYRTTTAGSYGPSSLIGTV